jgi:hypothetical protein
VQICSYPCYFLLQSCLRLLNECYLSESKHESHNTSLQIRHGGIGTVEYGLDDCTTLLAYTRIVWQGTVLTFLRYSGQESEPIHDDASLA